MTNSLDPDQARLFVGPDLGPNCLQMLSTDVNCVDENVMIVIAEPANDHNGGLLL